MRLALLLALLPLALWGCGSFLERSLIYYPTRRLEATPREYRLVYEEVYFTTEDGVRLHGWYVPGRLPVTLLWAHGNAGNISHRLENLKLLQDRLGIGVFLFDYRGYGESEGTPSEEGTYRDARAALAWVRGRADLAGTRLVYFGRSLGAAVALELARHAPPDALILESPFLSVQALANATLPGVGYLFRTRYDALEKIAQVRAPLLILHGDADEVIPQRHGRRLFEAANEPKAFHALPGARHNDTYLAPGYFEALAGWLRSTGLLEAGG